MYVCTTLHTCECVVILEVLSKIVRCGAVRMNGVGGGKLGKGRYSR